MDGVNMNIQVIHRIFGNGNIVSQTDKIICVSFENDGVERKFLYPDAFEQYLTYVDPAQQESIEQILAMRKDKAAQEAARREQERIEAMEMLRIAKQNQAAEKRKTSIRSTTRKGKGPAHVVSEKTQE